MKRNCMKVGLHSSLINDLKSADEYEKEFIELSKDFMQIFAENFGKDDKAEGYDEKLDKINLRLSEINILLPIIREYNLQNKKEDK